MVVVGWGAGVPVAVDGGRADVAEVEVVVFVAPTPEPAFVEVVGAVAPGRVAAIVFAAASAAIWAEGAAAPTSFALEVSLRSAVTNFDVSRARSPSSGPTRAPV